MALQDEEIDVHGTNDQIAIYEQVWEFLHEVHLYARTQNRSGKLLTKYSFIGS